MADTGFKDAMGIFDQLIAQQQAVAAQKPQGIFANVDPVMLGLAQGLLSPTKTGGFGESIGAGLAGAQGPLESIRKRQMDAQNKIMELQLARAKMQMEEPLISARASYLMSGGAGGRDSINSQRNLLISQINSLGNAIPGQTINPSTGLPFVDDKEIEDYGATLQSELLALTPRGAAPSKSTPKQDKKDGEGAKTDASSAPPEKGVLQKTKEFLGIGGDEAQKKTPPKDYPDARLGAGGHWYVIRDGKPYRVDE